MSTRSCLGCAAGTVRPLYMRQCQTVSRSTAGKELHSCATCPLDLEGRGGRRGNGRALQATAFWHAQE